MSSIWLSIVTENQPGIEQANQLASQLASDLGLKQVAAIVVYTKFENSYRIEFEKVELGNENLNEQCLQLVSQIVQPWLVYYDEDSQSIELIFNQSKSSQFVKDAYSAIKWANAGIKKN